jgi:hypothetical protein
MYNRERVGGKKYAGMLPTKELSLRSKNSKLVSALKLSDPIDPVRKFCLTDRYLRDVSAENDVPIDPSNLAASRSKTSRPDMADKSGRNGR